MRYVQVKNEDGSFEYVPAVERGSSPRVHIRGDTESFVSPVDGTVIGGRRQLRDHNRRNNVVSAEEFSPGYYKQKAAERADFYLGTANTIAGARAKRERRQEIAEIIDRSVRDE